VPGSTATRYAYALVRNGTVIQQSSASQELHYNAIRIQERSATLPGLGAGTVSLYVWGIDQQGNPSDAVKTDISLP